MIGLYSFSYAKQIATGAILIWCRDNVSGKYISDINFILVIKFASSLNVENLNVGDDIILPKKL